MCKNVADTTFKATQNIGLKYACNMLILSVKVFLTDFGKKFLANFHYTQENQKQLFSRTTFQWLLPKTIMLVILQEHIKIFPFHTLLVPKTKKGKKKGFQGGKSAQHMLISSTDSRLNMLRRVMLRKKTCNYSLIPILYDSKKRKTRSHIFRWKHLSLHGNQVFCENKSNF